MNNSIMKYRYIVAGLILALGGLNILQSMDGFNLFTIVGAGLGIAGILLVIKGIMDLVKKPTTN